MLFRGRNTPLLFSPDELRFGDNINSTSKETDWYDVPTHVIRMYQFLHFYKHWKTTHVVKFVGTAHGRFETPQIFEWTFPTARFMPFDEWYEPDKKTYSVHRYADAIPSSQAEEQMLAFFNEMDGTIYDVPSLFNFLILDFLGYDEADWKPIFDLGSKNMVCSVGVRAAEMKWYNESLIDTPCRRPGGRLHVEKTPPALFPGHDTYLHLGAMSG